MAAKFEEVQKLSIEQLKQAYDNLAGTTQVGLTFYRDEIFRRESELATQKMVDLTEVMKNLTIAVLVLTAVGVVVASVSVWIAIGGPR